MYGRQRLQPLRRQQREEALTSSRHPGITRRDFYRKELNPARNAPGRNLVAEVIELQRQLDIRFAQQCHRLLQVIPLLAGHADLIALNL